MDKKQAASDILAHALPLVPFEGWTQATLCQAAKDAGYKSTDTIRVFPGGAIDAIAHFMRSSNEEMEQTFSQYNLETMKIRTRIATAVRLKLEIMAPHREAVRKALATLSLPFNAGLALTLLYETVDSMWHASGDTSTDFNFYSKRLLLAGVYSSTLLYWLDDKSPAYEASWSFLDRRIEDVMKIEKAKHQLRGLFRQAA